MPAHHLRNSGATPWLDGALLGLLGGVLLWASWRRWTDPLIDFGRELYVPWQLSLGRTLYGDIAYFNGPLSPYLNSIAFRFFGASLTILVLFNLFLLALATWLLYRILERRADRLTALVGCSLFLAVFALADLIGIGNYNFITPYSHEMTHATLLSLALIRALDGVTGKTARWRWLVVGALLGLVFLTKAEFLVASIAAIATVLLLQPRDRRQMGQWLVSLVGGFLAVPIIAYAGLVVKLPAGEALRGVLGPWPYVFLQELTELVFYRQGLGTENPIESTRRLVSWLGVYLLVLGPVWLVARRLDRRSRQRHYATILLSLWVAALFLTLVPKVGLADLPRPLPVILAAAIVLGGIEHGRRLRGGLAVEDVSIADLTWQVFALVLLAKMALHVRFHNYGFALAMPATMALVALLVFSFPRRIDGSGGYGKAFRIPALIFLLLTGVAFARPSWQVYEQKNTLFGIPPDHIRVQDRYDVVQRLLDRLPQHLAPGETLLVLPEGVMLNYQLRVENPTPHINFMPPELIMFGEQRIIASLDESPPDVIVLIKRRTIEYGFESIGDGYGEALMQWVEARYPIVEALEDPDLFGKNFGRAFILRHRPAGVAATPGSREPRAAP